MCGMWVCVSIRRNLLLIIILNNVPASSYILRINRNEINLDALATTTTASRRRKRVKMMINMIQILCHYVHKSVEVHTQSA